MTIQWKRLMELADFGDMGLRCKDCGTTVSFPLGKTPSLERLRHCPNCHEEWLGIKGMEEKFAAFVDSAVALRDALAAVSTDPHGFTLSLYSNERGERFG